MSGPLNNFSPRNTLDTWARVYTGHRYFRVSSSLLTIIVRAVFQVPTWPYTNQPTSRQRPGEAVQETPTTATRPRYTTADTAPKRSKNRRRGGPSICCSRIPSGRCRSLPEDVAVSVLSSYTVDNAHETSA